MKKIIIALSLISSSVFSQPLLNFQFQFANSAGTVLTTTGVTTFDYSDTHPSSLKIIDVDLYNWVCEGDVIQMKNLTSGAWDFPSYNVDATKNWQAAWGWYHQEQCANNANWGATQMIFSSPVSQPWYQTSKNITIPVGPPAYTAMSKPCAPSGSFYTFPSAWMTQAINMYASNYTYKFMLVSPLLSTGFTGLNGGVNTACNRGVALRIRVRRAPEALAGQTICFGQTTNITVPSGVTATNWLPSNPNLIAPLTTTNYTVTVSNGICSTQQNVLVTVVGTALAPSITGPSTICWGTPLTYTGNESTGQGIEANWEIIECNSTGTTIGGVLNTSGYGNFIGTQYTFPATNLVCGKYYKVKYTVHGIAVGNVPNTNGYCDLYKTVEKIVYVACKPIASYDGETNVCAGSTVNLCAAVPSGSTVKWYIQGFRNYQTTPCISFVPSGNLTVTLTLTNQYGCSSSSVIPINVYTNNPDFNLAAVTTGPTTFTCSAAPIITNANSAPGFGFAWGVEEVAESVPGSGIFNIVIPNTTISNPSCWWFYPAANVFSGYNGTSTLNCGAPAIGQFTKGHYYRITRGTWNNYCPWSQKSYIAFIANGQRTTNGTVELTVVEDLNSPDMSHLKIQPKSNIDLADLTKVNLFPNPTSGLVKIESNETIKSITVTTITGAVVVESNATESVDLSNYPAGMYFFTITTENAKKTIKIIKE